MFNPHVRDVIKYTHVQNNLTKWVLYLDLDDLTHLYELL